MAISSHGFSCTLRDCILHSCGRGGVPVALLGNLPSFSGHYKIPSMVSLNFKQLYENLHLAINCGQFFSTFITCFSSVLQKHLVS